MPRKKRPSLSSKLKRWMERWRWSTNLLKTLEMCRWASIWEQRCEGTWPGRRGSWRGSRRKFIPRGTYRLVFGFGMSHFLQHWTLFLLFMWPLIILRDIYTGAWVHGGTRFQIGYRHGLPSKWIFFAVSMLYTHFYDLFNRLSAKNYSRNVYSEVRNVEKKKGAGKTLYFPRCTANFSIFLANFSVDVD